MRIDVDVKDRTFLHLYGMNHYTESGTIGFPSLATAEKWRILVEELVSGMEKRGADVLRRNRKYRFINNFLVWCKTILEIEY